MNPQINAIIQVFGALFILLGTLFFIGDKVIETELGRAILIVSTLLFFGFIGFIVFAIDFVKSQTKIKSLLSFILNVTFVSSIILAFEYMRISDTNIFVIIESFITGIFLFFNIHLIEYLLEKRKKAISKIA